MNGPPISPPMSLSGPMTDPFRRNISYLRVSVTDRCDLRCFYCMSEDMTFLPKADLLTLEELDRLCSAFIAKGVRKLRLTGGQPPGAGPVQRDVAGALAVAPSSNRRAQRTDADHQRLAIGAFRRRIARLRGTPH